MTRTRGRTLAARTAGAVLLTALAGLGLAGCGGTEDDPGADASPTAASSGPTRVEVDPSEAASDSAAPASVGEFCAPYVEMRRTLEGIDYTLDDDEIARQMVPVMKEWADQVPDLERPPGLSDEVWDGLQLLARRISALPDEPTGKQLDAVDHDLSRADQQLISAASDWFQRNCVLDEPTE